MISQQDGDFHLEYSLTTNLNKILEIRSKTILNVFHRPSVFPIYNYKIMNSILQKYLWSPMSLTFPLFSGLQMLFK